MKAASKKKKANEPWVACAWQKNCAQVFNDEMALNSHIEQHLGELKDSGVEEHICIWGSCEFRTKCWQEFERHAYFHGYYETLLVRGKHECASNPGIPSCTAPPMDGDKIPDLLEDFLCEWADCERKFASIVEFQDHIVQHASFEYEIQKTPDDVCPKIQCNWNYCRKELDNKYRFIEHIRTHSSRKQVACHNCGEMFRTKTTLFDHLRRQPENNTHKFQCAQCFKGFATEKLLRSHLSKHVNCYKCCMCDMSCSSASSLATHVRFRHLKEKPFKCMHCDHRAVREFDLNRHIEHVHKTKLHKCEDPGCDYSTRSYYRLRRHYLEVHGNSPYIYVCHCCDKLFKNGKSLSAHLIKKHDFQLPSGHKRFTYRVDENGFYTLETKRIVSLEVTKQLVTPNPDATQDSSCYEIVSNDERIIVSNDAKDKKVVGEVVISLPTLDKFQ